MDEFEVIATFVNLCRSGNYKTGESVMLRLLELFPECEREQLESVVQPAINSMCKTWRADD